VKILITRSTIRATGATGELGQAIALGSAASGANIIIHYCRADAKFAALRQRAQNLTVIAHVAGGDLASDASIGKLSSEIWHRLPVVNPLLANAVIQYTHPL
jgi:short-subunit dehydrogenase